MSRVLVPRTHRMACLAAAVVIAWVAMFSPGAHRDGAHAFAAPSAKKPAAIRQRVATAAAAVHAAHPASALKGPKRLKAATSPAKRAPRLYRPDAEPLPDGPYVVNGQGYLAKDVYTQLRGDAEAVMTQLPPKTHYYIGVGRSPTALVTFLSLVAPDNAVSFPSSGLRHGVSPQHIAEFERHLEALIPPEAFTSGKTIVLMDTVSGGGSLRAMRDRLAAYSLKKYGKPVNIALLGLGGTADGITHRIRSTAFLKAGKDDIAPYIGEHLIGRNTLEELPAKRNPKHADFRIALAQRMIRDPELNDIIAATWRLAKPKVFRRMTQVGAPVSFAIYSQPIGPADTAVAQEAIVALLGPIAWDAAPGATIRLAMTPTREGVVVTSNVDAKWLARLQDPRLLKSFGAFMAGPVYGRAQAIEIEATLDKDGRVSGRDAVAIIRKGIAVSPKEFRSRPTKFSYPPKTSARPSYEQAKGVIQGDLASALSNVVIAGGGPITAHIHVRTLRIGGAAAAEGFTTLPASLQPTIESEHILGLIAAMANGDDSAVPRDVDIAIKFGADGKLAGRDAIEITFPLRELKRQKRMVPHGTTGYRGVAMLSKADATTDVRRRLARDLGNTRVAGGAGPVVIEIERSMISSGRYEYTIASDLPPGALTWVQGNSVYEGIEGLYVARDWDGSGIQTVPGTLRIEIDVDQAGRPLVDDSMRIMKVARRVPLKPASRHASGGVARAGGPAEGMADKVAHDIASSWKHLVFEGGGNRAFTVTYAAVVDPQYGLDFKIHTDLPSELLQDLMHSADPSKSPTGMMLARLALTDEGKPGPPVTMTIKLDSNGRVADASAVRIERGN
ncbi:MAG: hypothetical protein IPL79_03370 [Myxococcales bacterium]|nr:hypothetical protein [Myxococcales bacterium]